MQPILLGLLLLVVIVVLWAIGTANRLVRLRMLCRESWAQVDVVLKRRYDLIPNLVETCKAYAAFERDTLDRVIQARNAAMHANGQPAAENAMVTSVNRLFARAEAYPDLKANQSYLMLQQELANTEDRIAAARRFYNANVRDFNTAISQFPTSLLAGKYEPQSFFEVEDLAVRQPISIRL